MNTSPGRVRVGRERPAVARHGHVRRQHPLPRGPQHVPVRRHRVPDEGDDDRLTEVLARAAEHLDRPLPVPGLGRRALMSRRTFARRFTAATGTTPPAWLLGRRLSRAEELLETTDLPVEEVARRSGFGSAAVLRDQFVRRRGVPPRTYRRTFGRVRESA